MTTATMKRAPLCAYDECDISTERVEYLMAEEDMSQEEAENSAYEDSDIYNWAWEEMEYTLDEYMEGKSGYWRADGTQMGWQNLTGYKVFRAESGKELLQEVLPETDCTIKVWKHYKGMKMKVSHHDSPMGEHYIIKPITEKEYDRE